MLIHGIGGGLATAALQLAKVAGAECTVTSSDDAKLERAPRAGRRPHRQLPLGRRRRAVRAGMGAADLVVDSVGAAVWEASFRLLEQGGRLVNAGATGGDSGTVPIVHLFWRQLEIIGTTMATDAEFRRALDLMVSSGQRAVVDRVVPLAGVPEALLALERGEQFGKIVVSRA